MFSLKEDRKFTADMKKSAVVWTQDNCSWCQRVKNLLNGMGYLVTERNLAELKPEVRDAFKSKFKTVPQVIIGGDLIGGFDAVLRYMQRSKLQQQAEPA